MTCCTFGRFEIRTLTPNRFKNETNDTLTLLGHNYNHQRGFLKQKIVTLHCCGFHLNSLSTFTKIAILRKIYQCSNCYTKVEQHWVECICVHSSPITRLFDHKMSGLSISAHFHKNFLIVTCCTFVRFKVRTYVPKVHIKLFRVSRKIFSSIFTESDCNGE